MSAPLAVGSRVPAAVAASSDRLSAPDQKNGTAAAPTMAAFPEQIQLWQGAWVMRGASYPGSLQAWNVRGAEVSVYDARSHGTARETLRLLSPCRAERTRALGESSETIDDTFVFAADGLHLAPDPASGGLRHGDLVVACFPDAVYAYQPATSSCWKWDPDVTGPPGNSDSECAVVGAGPTTSFVLRPYDGGVVKRLDFYGTALLSQPLLADIAERLPTFEAAKRRADALE